jgi:hypothetical protein
MANTCVYWIGLPNHTSIFEEGYIGISSRLKDRWNRHKQKTQNKHLKNAIVKYGWDALIKKVILIAKNDYCLEIENKLRPHKNIGWNIEVGGGKPPAQVNSGGFKKGMTPWNKGIPMSEESKAKVSAAKIGQPIKRNKSKSTPAWNKGLKTPDEVKIKQRNAKLGKKLSQETRDKMSKTHLKKHMEKINGKN